MDSSYSNKSKPFGVLTIAIIIFLMIIMLPGLMSMAAYENRPIRETTIRLIAFVIWETVLVIAGLSVLFFKKLARGLYIGALVLILLDYMVEISLWLKSHEASIGQLLVNIVMMGVIIYVIPVSISIIGINIMGSQVRSDS